MGLRQKRRKRRYARGPLDRDGELLLALDTSSEWLNLVLFKGDALVAELSSHQVYAHARTVLLLAQSLLESHKLSLDDVDVFGAGLGPGSFTGLRVGVTAVKGLAYGRQKPCVGVPSTEILAVGTGVEDGFVATAIDAKKGEVYFGLHRFEAGACREVVSPFAASPEEGMDRLEETLAGTSALLVGSAVRLHPVLLEREAFHKSGNDSEPLHRVRPQVLGTLCYERFVAGRTLSSAELEPVYARAPIIHGHNN